jgi:hypothetical protein
VKFRLNAGRPAPVFRGGPSVRAEGTPPRAYWAPNTETPVLLKCGCSIPWPVLTLVGSGGKVVLCEQHGQQEVTQKDVTDAKRKAKQWECTDDQSILDLPPY